jgi:hypothetical protein
VIRAASNTRGHPVRNSGGDSQDPKVFRQRLKKPVANVDTRSESATLRVGDIVRHLAHRIVYHGSENH